MQFFILPVLLTCVCATNYPSPIAENPEALPTDRRERTGSDFELVSTEEAHEIGHANLLRVKEKEPVSSWASGLSWFGFRNLGQADTLDSVNAKNSHPSEHAADEDELQAEPEIIDSAHDTSPSVAPGKTDEAVDPSNVDSDTVAETNATVIPSEPPVAESTLSTETSNEVGFRKNSSDKQSENGPVNRWIWAAAILLLAGVIGGYLRK